MCVHLLDGQEIPLCGMCAAMLIASECTRIYDDSVRWWCANQTSIKNLFPQNKQIYNEHCNIYNIEEAHDKLKLNRQWQSRGRVLPCLFPKTESLNRNCLTLRWLLLYIASICGLFHRLGWNDTTNVAIYSVIYEFIRKIWNLRFHYSKDEKSLPIMI